MKDKIIEDWYVDLDGVLVDFIGGYFKLTGIDITGNFDSSPPFWAPIDKAGVPFWANLEFTNDGKKLWSYVKKYDPVILSSPSRKSHSKIGKKIWMKMHLPRTELILCESHLKRKYAHPGAVLIDDREININQWVKAKGIGILFKSSDQVIKELKEIGL